MCRSYSLPVKDHGGRTWEFVIKSWANGTENRRVYVLEQTGEYLKVSTPLPPTLAVLRLCCAAVRHPKWSSSVLRRCSVQPRCCCGLHLSPPGHWEPVPQMLQLLCVTPQLANTQSIYYTCSLSCWCSGQC